MIEHDHACDTTFVVSIPFEVSWHNNIITCMYVKVLSRYFWKFNFDLKIDYPSLCSIYMYTCVLYTWYSCPIKQDVASCDIVPTVDFVNFPECIIMVVCVLSVSMSHLLKSFNKTNFKVILT